MPSNTLSGYYTLNPPYLIFDEMQHAINNLFSKIEKSIELNPIQLHFEFYKELHYKPKKKKSFPKGYELCPR